MNTTAPHARRHHGAQHRTQPMPTAAAPTPPAAANASSPRSTAPSPSGAEISVPPSPAPPASTAASSTATATCSKDPRRRRRTTRHQRRRAGGHPRLPASRPARRPRTHPPAQQPDVHQLEKRLSEALGEHAWRQSGLGAPADIDALHQQITHLEQQAPTCDSSSTNATTTSPPPAPPTVNSWPASTPPTPTGETPPVTCTTPVASIRSSLSASELHKREDSAATTGRTRGEPTATSSTTLVPRTRRPGNAKAPNAPPTCPCGCTPSPGAGTSTPTPPAAPGSPAPGTPTRTRPASSTPSPRCAACSGHNELQRCQPPQPKTPKSPTCCWTRSPTRHEQTPDCESPLPPLSSQWNDGARWASCWSSFRRRAVAADGTLTIAGCRADELAEEFGTPAMIVDESALRRRAREYRIGSRRAGPPRGSSSPRKPFPAPRSSG